MKAKAMASVAVLLLLLLSPLVAINGGEGEFPGVGPLLATKESRRTLASAESGEITAVDVPDGCGGAYHLQFISMAPSSLFLPVLLHTDMVFFVQTGRGRVTYINENEDDKTEQIDVERGDVYRLEKNSIFYVHSHTDPGREKLRIHAIFNAVDIENREELAAAAYSNISDLVRNFDGRVLQRGFGVSEETIRTIKRVEAPPSIVPYKCNDDEAASTTANRNEENLYEALRVIRIPSEDDTNKKKKEKEKKKKEEKARTFNFYKAKPDIENCNGWSTVLTQKDLKALKGSSFGAFMVNLSTGSMMGPHWNPKATEIYMMIHGMGMVQVVCPGKASREAGGGDGFKCQEKKFQVKAGDVLAVPRFHPVTHVSYNNESFVYVGFTTGLTRGSHPQFLAGKRSVLQTIDREILAMAFNVPNSTIADLLSSKVEPILLQCTSCAEELERKMEEQPEREKEGEGGEGGEETEPERRKEEEEEGKEETEPERRKEEEGGEETEGRRKREEGEEEEEKAAAWESDKEGKREKRRKLELMKRMWMLQLKL